MYVLPQVVILILVHQFQHHRGKPGIELGSAAFFDFLPDLFPGQGIPVAAAAGHGVIGVGHGDDPRFLGNLFAREAVGISCSVVPLVMPAGAGMQEGMP